MVHQWNVFSPVKWWNSFTDFSPVHRWRIPHTILSHKVDARHIDSCNLIFSTPPGGVHRYNVSGPSLQLNLHRGSGVRFGHWLMHFHCRSLPSPNERTSMRSDRCAGKVVGSQRIRRESERTIWKKRHLFNDVDGKYICNSGGSGGHMAHPKFFICMRLGNVKPRCDSDRIPCKIFKNKSMTYEKAMS